jgi:hypothetical protein
MKCQVGSETAKDRLLLIVMVAVDMAVPLPLVVQFVIELSGELPAHGAVMSVGQVVRDGLQDSIVASGLQRLNDLGARF